MPLIDEPGVNLVLVTNYAESAKSVQDTRVSDHYENWASHSSLDAESGGDGLDAAVMMTSDQYYDSVGQWMPGDAGAYPQAYIIEYNGISENIGDSSGNGENDIGDIAMTTADITASVNEKQLIN